MIPRLRTLPAALLLLAALSGCAVFIGHFVLPEERTRPAAYDVMKSEESFRTSDGILLVADVYRPAELSSAPTILVRIPFSDTFMNRLKSETVAGYWASRGYNVVIQGTRGRYKSGGDYYPLQHERQDGLETLAWLDRQPWHNGKTGTWGGSAFGYTQWAISDQLQPGYSAMMVQISSTRLAEAFHPGGAFSLESALYWAAMSHGEEDSEPSYRKLAKGFSGWPLITADKRAVGASIGFFNDWVIHKPGSPYWNQIDGRDRALSVQVPVHLMAGWFDPFLAGQLADFEDLRRNPAPGVAGQSRLVIGPWAHARTVELPEGFEPEPYRKISLEETIPWFDRQLGLAPAGENPPVRIFVMGENMWRSENEWPLARTRYTDFYLDSTGLANGSMTDGRISIHGPIDALHSDTFAYDPVNPVPSTGGAMLGERAGIRRQNEIEKRLDVLKYTSGPLTGDLEITGTPKLRLFVRTTAPNTDFTAKLVNVFPDGSAYNVSEGILRQNYDRYPAPVEIEIVLSPTSQLFRTGHRIRLEVSSSSFPRYDRNPNSGGNIPEETRPFLATQTVFHGKQFVSRLILPVIPR